MSMAVGLLSCASGLGVVSGKAWDEPQTAGVLVHVAGERLGAVETEGLLQVRIVGEEPGGETIDRGRVGLRR